jgi:hypothetical protein
MVPAQQQQEERVGLGFGLKIVDGRSRPPSQRPPMR